MASINQTEGPLVTFNAAKLAVLSPSLWKEINAWVPLKGKRLVATRALPLHLQESLAEALPLLAKMVEPGSVEENEAMNKAILDDATRRQAEEAQHQAVIDGGNAQLAAYQKVGLADTERNAKIIQDAIARRDKGVFCSVSVRNAVEAERSNLEWVKVAATPAATPVPPAPVDLLPNGEPVLPLDADAYQMRKASTEQLRDLSRRRGEGQSRHGWSSARL